MISEAAPDLEHDTLAPAVPAAPPTPSTLPTLEALDQALRAASLAVAEARRILIATVGTRALFLADQCCAQVEVVSAAAETCRTADVRYCTATEARWALENAVQHAVVLERDARQRAKQYAKLLAKHAAH